ncbi:MAG TPA: ATP-binding protein [Allosphingosinicella sp.]|jgi:signal transduction histidine kinase|nr:ATP-binding protein [Allosphingosinicella sp.]
MRLPSPFARKWSAAPAAIVAVVVLLLLAGIGVIVQSEAAYRDLQQQETRVQADILAASVTAALDFGDRVAADEAIDAIRVNRQVRSVGVYNGRGALIAGYSRDGGNPPARLAEPVMASGNEIVSAVPVTSGRERIGTVVLAADPEPVSRRLSRYLVIGLLILMAALVVAVLGFAQNALKRANRELEERADALADANAELKVQVSERGKAEEQLRQAHKMQALGQLTGGIAHDFNNLLTVIQGSADMLRRPGITEDKRVRFAEAVVQASSRAAALTGQLLAFARRQPLQPEVIDLNALIRGMTDLLDRTLGERIEVTTELSAHTCTVEADRTQLESALLNVAVNARDAMPGGGRLVIRTASTEDPERGAMIALSVGDSGAGMDEDTLNRAFEPFFTTKTTGKGTGLGLSQVYGFASQSGGDVQIASRPGEGTIVTLLLPCSGSAEDVRTVEGNTVLRRGRTGRILLVEDNDEVGEFAEQLLDELGHEVVRARSGEEALDRALAERFDLVFTDVVMPGMSGLDLAGRLAERRAGLPVILTTGYSDEIARSGAGGRPVILKPYRPETLAEAIEQALSDRQG